MHDMINTLLWSKLIPRAWLKRSREDLKMHPFLLELSLMQFQELKNLILLMIRMKFPVLQFHNELFIMTTH